jgi:hypothetical protein
MVPFDHIHVTPNKPQQEHTMKQEPIIAYYEAPCGTEYQAISTNYTHQRPNRSSWDSDVDYYGYTEVVWSLFDMDGHAVPEVEAGLSKNCREYIEENLREKAAEAER